ncbi:MAG: hypothetical protein Q4Q58_01855 [Thermoplasmata archaeon]|nr:hypothetical protein [Thermoplasmata archaeon]
MTPTGKRWIDDFERDRRPRDVRLAEVKKIMLDAEASKPKRCPYCECGAVVRHGKTTKGTARFRCRGCGKTFVPQGVISGSRITVEQWMTFAECYINEDSVRKSADRCGVSVATAYRMRKRLEALIEESKSIRNTAPTGIGWHSARAY